MTKLGVCKQVFCGFQSRFCGNVVIAQHDGAYHVWIYSLRRHRFVANKFALTKNFTATLAPTKNAAIVKSRFIRDIFLTNTLLPQIAYGVHELQICLSCLQCNQPRRGLGLAWRRVDALAALS